MIKVGDVFKGGVANDRYYEVTRVLKRMVKVRELERRIVEVLEDGLIYYRYAPLKGQYISEEVTKKVKDLGDGVMMIKIDGVSYYRMVR